MTQFIITITEKRLTSIVNGASEDVEHYRRRVETDDINFIIQRLDQSLNVKVRKPRRDKGQPRTPAEQ